MIGLQLRTPWAHLMAYSPSCDWDSDQLLRVLHRKKYRKMRLRFEDKMRDSDILFKQEQAAIDTARRLVEQNDQILELLLDVNNSIHIPPHHRYNLRLPSDPPSLSRALSPALPTI